MLQISPTPSLTVSSISVNSIPVMWPTILRAAVPPVENTQAPLSRPPNQPRQSLLRLFVRRPGIALAVDTKHQLKDLFHACIQVLWIGTCSRDSRSDTAMVGCDSFVPVQFSLLPCSVAIAALRTPLKSMGTLSSQAVCTNGRTLSLTCSAVNGLRMYPCAPARMACLTCSSLDSVVIITTGTPGARFLARI